MYYNKMSKREFIIRHGEVWEVTDPAGAYMQAARTLPNGKTQIMPVFCPDRDGIQPGTKVAMIPILNGSMISWKYLGVHVPDTKAAGEDVNHED